MCFCIHTQNIDEDLPKNQAPEEVSQVMTDEVMEAQEDKNNRSSTSDKKPQRPQVVGRSIPRQ